MKDLTKQERIEKELARLKKLFKDIPDDKRNTVSSLLANTAFMTITLEDLQNEINVKGVVSDYQNGSNQWGKKKSPEIDIYNTMIKNHASLIKQLVDLLPDTANDPSEEILQFALGGKR
ncbi:MAG: hypothetical protein K0M69_05410 [Youngiibacter sp.]|nr:hypothetical protein [Youngiibacter sp.]